MSDINKNSYFNEALSDFVHDVASGGAIRHLVDLGYSFNQIMESLTYPEKPERIRKVMLRYMTESGILSYQPLELPEKTISVKGMNITSITALLYDKTGSNLEINSFLSCPFGLMDHETLKASLAFLSKREWDYIDGIPWEKKTAYHRLTPRMREIASKLLCNGFMDCRVFFMKEGLAVICG